MVLIVLLQILTPKPQDNHQTTTKKIILKKRTKMMTLRDLLEQLEKIRKDYEKTEKENENLIKNSNYSDVLNKLIWGYISSSRCCS
ncbi:hypothetical protein HYE21_01935 [Mycoplasmopsis bovis]|nr:hypothetical protein [Mycoplasmopsis bovis]QQH24351.1 hypothetical protein HYE21_01935 [Mycoplasmopsis bovis]